MNGLTNLTQVSGLTVNYPRAVVTFGVLLLLTGAVVYMHSISALSRVVSGSLLRRDRQRRTNTQWSRSEVGAPLDKP